MNKPALIILPGELAIWKPTGNDPAPKPPFEDNDRDFYSITRIGREISVVSRPGLVPANTRCQRGWRCVSVKGPLDFSLTGILSSLAVPLAREGIPIFVISTFDTDHILIQEDNLARATVILESAGYHFEPEC